MFTANHRQHLLVAFRNIDESLAEIVRCIEPASADRVFPPWAGTADAAVGARVRAQATDIRDALRVFMTAHRMRAPEPTLSPIHAAQARASLALASALELDARHLNGYGELSPEECDALDAFSGHLGEQMMRLVAALDE